MKRRAFALIAMGVTAQAYAGAVLELVPEQTGPYAPDQAVSVDVWLHNKEAFGVDLRLVALDVQGLRQRLLAGGDFVTSGGVTVNHVAKFSGGSWQPLDTGTEGPVYALRPCTLNGGTTLYAGGYVDGVSDWEGAVHRLEAGWWTEIGRFGVGCVLSLFCANDGAQNQLYAGGYIWQSDVGIYGIAPWNGSEWNPMMPGLQGSVRDMVIFDDDTGPALYAGGRFTNGGGVSVSNIARWDGTNWTAVGAGFDDTVRALAVHEATGDPNLIIQGGFQFDFSSLTDGGAQYALFPELPGPLLIYVGDAIVPGSILHMPAAGSLRLGEMNVVMPNAPATYRLDVASPYGPRGGSILSFGFGGPGDPEIVWASETGELTGDPIPFTVQTGPPNNIPAVSTWGMIVLTLLLLVAATFVLTQRYQRTTVSTGGPTVL